MKPLPNGSVRGPEIGLEGTEWRGLEQDEFRSAQPPGLRR